jgi:cyanophycin synthetase
MAGMKTGFGKTRSTGDHGIYKMAFRTRDESSAAPPCKPATPC